MPDPKEITYDLLDGADKIKDNEGSRTVICKVLNQQNIDAWTAHKMALNHGVITQAEWEEFIQNEYIPDHKALMHELAVLDVECAFSKYWKSPERKVNKATCIRTKDAIQP